MKNIQLIIIVVVACLLGSMSADAQVVRKSYRIDDIDAGMNISGSTPTTDGGLLITGFETYSSMNGDPTPAVSYIMKVDSLGDLIWLDTFHKANVYGDPELTSDGGFLTYIKKGLPLVTALTYEVAKFDALGNFLFSIPISDPNGLGVRYFELNGRIIISKPYHQTWERYNLNDGIMIDSVSYSTGTPLVFEYSLNQELSGHANEFKAINSDGSRIAISGRLEEYQMSTMTYRKNAALLIVDSLGNTIDFKYETYSDTTTTSYATGVAATSDGGFIIAAKRAGHVGFFIRTDANGDTLWTKDLGVFTYSSYSDLGVFSSGNIACWGNLYDAQGNLLQNNFYYPDQGGTHIGEDVIYNVTGISASPFDSVIIYIDYSAGLQTYTNFIKGNVYSDLSFDCTKNGGEQNLGGIQVKAEGLYTFYGTTDAMGNYSILVDTGTYIISPVLPSPYYMACVPNPMVSFSTINTNDTIDIALQTFISCPMIQVDLSAPFIRQTNGGSAYTVAYYNRGTEAANNVTIEVELDPFLTVLSTGIPVISQSGNIYTFSIGTVLINETGSFQIQVVVDPLVNVQPGQTCCSEAHVYPDSICVPNYWNGPIIDVSGECLNDTVHFRLENIGAPMLQTLEYFVYEDNVMFKTGTTTVLGTGGVDQISEPALAGKAYRIDVRQATGFPALLGDSVATAVIEGCVLDAFGLFNTGFVTQFSNGSSSPFVAIDCQSMVAAYDPNDKSSQPEGYDSQHYIYDYTALDYKIRFQNTGNDTAFLVIVRDTISPYLDPATIQMGASSHAYTWRLYGQGILEVTFDGILLADSTVNEPASHGFFRYRIEQKANNPIGTIINNTAAIYFDYNPPIFTNTTYHTVGENFITINLSVGKIYEEKVAVKVFPNPFTHSTTIQVEGKAYQNLKLSVFDVAGRLVAEESSAFTNSIELQNNNFGAGIYIYRLEGDGRLINTGKLIVQ